MIGTAVVKELLSAGHQVLGLARSEQSAKIVKDLGAEVHQGDITDSSCLPPAAKICDGVIHLAHLIDPGPFTPQTLPDSMAVDRRTIAVLGEALTGTNKPLIGTTGVAVLTPNRIGTENDPGDPSSAGGFRVPSENDVLAFGSRGVRASVVRLAPSVHSPEDYKGFIPMLIDVARKKGKSAYIGEGLNRWTAIHRLDAASLYRLVLEKGEAGAKYLGVGDEGTQTRKIAETIGRKLNLPVASISPEEATEHFGPFLGFLFAVDNPASNKITREKLGWNPKHLGLIADLEEDHYFANRN